MLFWSILFLWISYAEGASYLVAPGRNDQWPNGITCAQDKNAANFPAGYLAEFQGSQFRCVEETAQNYAGTRCCDAANSSRTRGESFCCISGTRGGSSCSTGLTRGETNPAGCTTQDFATAHSTCDGGTNLRLCTMEELRDGSPAAGTGCGYDSMYVWTSTECTPTSTSALPTTALLAPTHDEEAAGRRLSVVQV